MEATRTALKHYPQTAPNTNLRNQESSATNYSDCHDTLLGHQLCPLLCIYSNYPQTLLVLQVVHVGRCVRFVLHGVRTLMISRLCQMCADVIEVCVVVILGNAGGDQHIRVALSGRCVAVCWCDCLGATQTAFKHYPRQPQTLPPDSPMQTLPAETKSPLSQSAQTATLHCLSTSSAYCSATTQTTPKHYWYSRWFMFRYASGVDVIEDMYLEMALRLCIDVL